MPTMHSMQEMQPGLLVAFSSWHHNLSCQGFIGKKQVKSHDVMTGDP